MNRYRFSIVGNDPRPVNWPIKHPYWVTGYDGADQPVIVAYGDDDEYILGNWPDAELPLQSEPADRYVFTDRRFDSCLLITKCTLFFCTFVILAITAKD